MILLDFLQFDGHDARLDVVALASQAPLLGLKLFSVAFEALDKGVASVIIGKAEKMNELINGTSGTTITK